MKITIEQTHNSGYSKVIIENEDDYLDLEELMQILIKPALLAWGYQPDSINKYIEEEE